MISVISGIATMRSSEEANKIQVENFLEFQKCFFNQDVEEKELVLVEQRAVGATESAFDGLVDSRAEHKIVYNDRFSGAWLLNIGAVISHGDILAFVDADVCYGNNYLSRIEEDFAKSEYPYLHGYNYSHWFTEEGRRRYIEGGEFTLNWPTRDCLTGDLLKERIVTPEVGGNAGLSVLCERDFYFNVVGGHNESFIEGGGRDNDFAFRVVAKTGAFPIMQYTLLHLWHGSKIFGAQNQVIWPFTQRHPELVTQEILRLGIGFPDAPRNHTIEKWEELAKKEKP